MRILVSNVLTTRLIMSTRADPSNTSGPVRFLVHYLEISRVRLSGLVNLSFDHLQPSVHISGCLKPAAGQMTGAPPITGQSCQSQGEISLSSPFIELTVYHLPFIVPNRNYPLVVQMFKITQWIYYGREKLRYFQILVNPYRNRLNFDQWFFSTLLCLFFIEKFWSSQNKTT